ncbi:MAG: Panacea domain-containing protein [bacterium]
MQFDEQKFKELVLYIAGKCQGHSKYGKTKLNKILFFSDFIAYAKWGCAITGAEYFHLPKGPAPQQMLPIMEQMVSDHELAIVPRQIFAKTQERPTNLRNANLSEFSADELSLVDSVIEELREKSAEEVSSLSHYYIGWQLTQEGETIPYYSVHCRHPKATDITKEDIEEGMRTAREFGLLDAE